MNINKQLFSNILIIILICIITTLVVITITNNQDNKNDYNLESKESINKDAFKTNAVKKNFMNNCVIEPSFEGYCECAYNELVDNYNTTEIINMYVKYEKEDKFPEEMIDILQKCAYKLK